MKRIITLLLLCAMACTCPVALAAGVTVTTFTPFADMDFAAQAYNDLIGEWEAETGNFVRDFSGSMDEMWLGQLSEMAASGEADIVIVPVGSGLTGAELVTAAELMNAAPQLGAKVVPAMTEADGSVQLTPFRLNWEALYVNTDVLAAHGLSIPSSLEDLAAVCAQLSGEGVLPIANALFDWAEITLDCLALSGAPDALYGGQESLAGAKDALTTLAAVGAFSANPSALTDEETEEAFLSGEAAMRFDSDFLAYDVPDERENDVIVILPPTKGGALTQAVVGTPSVGLAVTRACFADEARREAAISLCEKLISQTALVTPADGLLGQSIAKMTKAVSDCTGLLYDANPDGFDAWSEQTVSSVGR